MNFDLPRPTGLSVILQSLAMLAFAVCLYLFGSAYQTNKQYSVALNQLDERKQQLNQAYQQVDKYMKFINTNPYYQKNLGEPQWEKVDETWTGLPYDSLLARFSSLYREDRPFILDYFSASLGKSSSTGESVERTEDPSKQNRKLIFHLQGYYLCPCQ